MNAINEVQKFNKAMATIKVITAQIPHVSRYESERSYRLAKLEAIYNRDDIDKLAKLVKSEHNTYGVERELERLDVIWRLALRGFSFSRVYDWVERQREGKVMFLIACGVKMGG